MDLDWWKAHQARVSAEFCGEPWSQLTRSGVHRLRLPYRVEDCKNSGAGAIALAAHLGARRIILLGFDQQGEHWHPDHPIEVRKPPNWPMWRERFEMLSDGLRKAGVTVINASRETSLECFQRQPLAEALQC